MPLTKTQKNELKKIDAGFTQIEKLSEKIGFSLEEYVPDLDFCFPDISNLQKKRANEQSRNRRQVFEQTKQRKTKAF